MVTSVSTAGQLLFNIRNLHTQQSKQTIKSVQYQTGQKYQEIAKYDQRLPLILKYRQEIEETEKFISSSQNVLNVLEITETVLEKTDETLGRLRDLLEGGLVFDSDTNPTAYQNWRERHEDLANDLLQEITDFLNTRVGQRYIFSGSRYTQSPVKQLDQLDNNDFHVILNTVPATTRPIEFSEFFPNIPGEVPDYDRSSTAGIIATANATPIAPGAIQTLTFDVDAEAFDQSLFYTGNTSTQTYGLSSNSDDFARLIYIARSFKQALSEPLDANRKAILNAALTEVQTADNGIILARQAESTAFQDIFNAQDKRQDIKTFRENYLAEIVTVNRETISIEFSALNNQIEANLTLIARQQRLSLTNYLR